MIINKFREYKTPTSICYAPEFESEVSRITVFKPLTLKMFPSVEHEIQVWYRDGRIVKHRLSEFEAVLNNVYEESVH